MIFNDLKTIFTKNGEMSSDFSPYMINRYLSFSSDINIVKITCMMDKYTFWLPKEMIAKMYMRLIPKGRPEYLKYIKKPKEEEQELAFILTEYKKMYGWSSNELRVNSSLLIEKFKDKEELKKAMDKFGVDLKHYKKMDMTTEKPKPVKQGLFQFCG